MALVFTRIPKRGDICIGRLSDNKILYVKESSVTAASDIDATLYEVNGVVVDVKDYNGVKRALIVALNNSSLKWAERYVFNLTGYVLDEAAHTSTFKVCDSSAWGTYNSYSFTYSATDIDGLVAQLNAWFGETDPFDAQDWWAENVDGVVKVHFNFTDYRQTSNSGTDGFTLTGALLPDIKDNASIRRKNGYVGGEGAISNMAKAIQYFSADNSNTAYNPASDVTSIKRNYPVCLPAYLGTSQHQSDHCALLRQYYGGGENGWLKFLEGCLPVMPSDWGTIGRSNGKEMTQIMAAATYNSRTKADAHLCPAANYCNQKATTTIPQGEWWLPTTAEVARIMDGIKYSSNGSNRNLDILNSVLYRLGGNAISNGSYVWSCCRYGYRSAWLSVGNSGYFYYSYVCYACLAIPVSLQICA